MKAVADNNLNFAQMMTSVINRVENIVGKEENAGYWHFPPFPTMFSISKDSSSGLLKLGIVCERVKKVDLCHPVFNMQAEMGQYEDTLSVLGRGIFHPLFITLQP